MSTKLQASIYSIQAKVVAHQSFEGKQYILTLSAPDIAKNTIAGQFVHIQCGQGLLMRRPLSIMFVDKKLGHISLLYKIIGQGTELLSQAVIGQTLATIGPIGNAFKLSDKKRPLLLGGGVGMPPMIAIAQEIKGNKTYQAMAILASEVPFPFVVSKSNIGHNFAQATHSMPLLEQWGIYNRLTSLQGYDGVYQGYITDLAKVYLDSLSVTELAEVEIFSCGPQVMLEAVAKLAKTYDLSCQISLEEYMACAVGGCAGCVVRVCDESGEAMKRVCVDGPVFDAKSII